MEWEITDDEEPVVCSTCESTPELFYRPAADAPYRLRCECDALAIDVTESLDGMAVIERSGKWSNFDYNSSLRYDEI